MSVKENLKKVLSSIPEDICLVAVSKTKPNEDIQQAYEVGQRIFGENKAQELKQKYETLPKDIQWHYIGHLQTNKIKYIAPFVSLIHGVDSIKLLKAINKEAKKYNRIIDCLLQFHIAEESTKFGLSYNEAIELLESDEYKLFENIRILGVMGMATYSNQQDHIRNEFKLLKGYFDKLKSIFFVDNPEFKEISMGMSGDYLLAVEEGSTMVRVGSSIFGVRNYEK